MIFAVPLCIIFVDREMILPVFLCISVIQSAIVAFNDRKYLDLKQFLKMLGLAIIGIPLGLSIGNFLPGNLLNFLFGIFIVLNSGYNLYKLLKPKITEPDNKLKSIHYTYPILSGFMQSAYGFGGPLICLYMNKITTNRYKYRAMLSLFWVTLNPMLIFGYIAKNGVVKDQFYLFGFMLIAVLLSIKVANIIIKKISLSSFQIFVNILLAIIGITMCL